jgi:hypothetical protein
MRPGIKKLQPKVWRGSRGKRQLFSQLDLGAVTRVEEGEYKLEGAIFATGDRQHIHAVIEQLMERVDQALDEARDADRPT